MRTQNKFFLLFLSAGLFISSCVNEQIEQPGGLAQGTPTRITVSIKADSHSPGDSPIRNQMQSPFNAGMQSPFDGEMLPDTRSVTTQEELITNVHIMVFNDAGDIQTNEHFGSLNITDTQTLPIETLPGDNRQIWVIANGDVNDDTNAGNNLDNDLKAVTTLDALKEILVKVKGNGIDRTGRLTMVGTTTVNITKPHNTAVPIQLHFLTAKVTVIVKDNTPEGLGITIIGWDMANLSAKTFLSERTGDNLQDAVNPGNMGDYITTSGKYAFATIDEAAKTWTQSMYLFENRRGGRVNRDDPTNAADKYPGMSVSDDNQRGKAWYAPPGATYMLIYGTYTKDGQMNNVIYKIYLGDNPVNDYNICRGKHYEYNVTINGLNDINVDTNVEWGSASFSVSTSDNLIMDAHPDFRVFQIGGTSVDGVTPAYATVEVLNEDGTTPCTWLAISPLNLYRHGIKQALGSNQQFGAGDGTGSFVRAKYTPQPTAESEFASTTFGMTRKLTKIPFNQPAVYTWQNIIVYADAYDDIDTRKAKVRITYYKGADGTEQAGQVTYDITQDGPIKISDDLYIERYEESAMLIHPNLPTGFQSTTTMQWGYNNTFLYDAADRFTNGNFLTANAVYNNVQTRNEMDAPVWTANSYADYRDKYPRSGDKVVEPTSLAISDPVYFYPVQESTTPLTDYFHPIFNSSAARYCHEKNRDVNGDGIISADETVWYLPSLADMGYIIQHIPVGLNLTGTYWTSSEESSTHSWAFTFTESKGTSTIKTTAYRVRCVRGNGIASIPEATIESAETDKTKINIAGTVGSNGTFLLNDASGLPWTITSTTSWLKIATSSTGTEAATTLSSSGNKTLYAYATASNPSLADSRSATLTLSRAGMVDKTITVIQGKQIEVSTVAPISINLSFWISDSAPIVIDNKNTELTWEATSDQSWLAIATNGMGEGAASSITGTESTTIYAYISEENTTTSKRIANITFSRVGMSNITIKITQKYFYLYHETPKYVNFAGCNIFWDPDYVNTDNTKGRLTFDDYGSYGRKSIQGVYFRWGSLVAISPGTESIIFSPSGKSYASLDAIPKIVFDNNNVKISASDSRNFIGENQNLSNDIGDICKYISDRGWLDGTAKAKKWRMPTKADMLATSWSKFGTLEYPAFDQYGKSPVSYYVATGTNAYIPASPLEKPSSGSSITSYYPLPYISINDKNEQIVSLWTPLYKGLQWNDVNYNTLRLPMPVRCVRE